MIIDTIIVTGGRVIIYGIMFLILYAALHVFDAQSARYPAYGVLGAVLVLLDIWLVWIYHALFESSSVQATPGKLVLGIKVVHRDNRALTFEEATVRYFSKILSSWTFLIGYILAGFSSKKQALHDFIARSLVVISN